MKTRLYIIRHAEAEGNVYRRIHGHYDSLVTPNGLRQIAALRERLRGERIDACYASDLIRTRTTAQAVYLPRGLPLRLDRRLREVNLGVWEDRPFGQLFREDGEQMRRFNDEPESWLVPGAERYPAYGIRFQQCVEELARRHEGQSIALVSHGSVIRSLQYRCFPSAEMPGHSDNTAVSLVEYEDGVFHPLFLNDNSHLSQEISTLAGQNWWRGGVDRNLWFRPMEGGRERLGACRRECWESLYGTPFPGGDYYGRALAGALGEPEAICDAMLDDEPVGLVQLDLSHSWGHIGLLYLAPAWRGQRLGEQLVGQAVSLFRRLGKDRLRLCVSPRNAPALALYRRCGFRRIGRFPGTVDELLVLELDLRAERDLAPEKLVTVTGP